MTEVTLLTKGDCDLCEQAKTVLARLAQEYPLELSELTLDSEAGRELAGAAAAPFLPVVFLDGKPFSYGRLSERKLRKALR